MRQVFTKSIGVDKYTNISGHRLLHPQFLGTARGIVGHMGAQRLIVADHPIERTAGANRFLLGQFLIGHNIVAVQFAPCSDHINVVERLAHPFLVMPGKLERGIHSQRM